MPPLALLTSCQGLLERDRRVYRWGMERYYCNSEGTYSIHILFSLDSPTYGISGHDFRVQRVSPLSGLVLLVQAHFPATLSKPIRMFLPGQRNSRVGNACAHHIHTFTSIPSNPRQGECFQRPSISEQRRRPCMLNLPEKGGEESADGRQKSYQAGTLPEKRARLRC